jgi:hypothetical protein
MFRLRQDKRAALNTFVAKLRQLEHDVPVIRFAEVLINQRQGPKSYDLMFHVRYDDEAGFRAYMTHPKHIPVMKYVDEVCDGVADIDVAGM